MPYWMTNPEHGVMPVYDTGEVERVKAHGWTLLNEGDSPLRKPVEAAPAAPVVERRKPGPKPKAK
jgi:hypothetical protein